MNKKSKLKAQICAKTKVLMQAQSRSTPHHPRPQTQKKYDMEEALAQDAARVAAASNALTYCNLPTREVTIWSSTPSTPKAACPTNPAWSLALNLAGVIPSWEVKQ
jgi:hypothetical protein